MNCTLSLVIEYIRYPPTGPHFNFLFHLPDIFFIVLIMNVCAYVKNDLNIFWEGKNLIYEQNSINKIEKTHCV